jgi:hypothetical protein
MKKSILKWMGVFIFLFSGLAQAERRHTIELTGAVSNPQLKNVSVEDLMKTFPQLAEITTQWRSEGRHQFKGILVRDFVKKYAQPGVTKVKMTATNEYSQALSAKDWDDWGALLAFEQDGEVIATKNKGTFRIVYDYLKFDKDMSVKSMLENNSVWQVVKVEFIK